MRNLLGPAVWIVREDNETTDEAVVRFEATNGAIGQRPVVRKVCPGLRTVRIFPFGRLQAQLLSDILNGLEGHRMAHRGGATMRPSPAWRNSTTSVNRWSAGTR